MLPGLLVLALILPALAATPLAMADQPASPGERAPFIGSHDPTEIDRWATPAFWQQEADHLSQDDGTHTDADRPPFMAQSGSYTLKFVCQGVVQRQPVVDEGTGCPAYVLDTHDAMSQPRLVVDPFNPNVIGFSALHGGQTARDSLDGGPPSARSRADEVHQPHTTFRSVDTGSSWQDMPYYAPEPLHEDEHEVFGEDNAIVLDDDGLVYLAATYAHREPVDFGRFTFNGTAAPFMYSVAVWKAGTLYRPVDYRSGITLLHAEGSENATSRTTTEDASGTPRIVNLGLDHDRQTRNIVALWREIPIDPEQTARTPPTTDPGKVRIHTSSQDEGNDWHEATLPGTPTACLHVTAPVQTPGGLVFGCLLDPRTAAATPGPGTPSNDTTEPDPTSEGGSDDTTDAFGTNVLRIYLIDLSERQVTPIADTVAPGNEPILFARGELGHLVAAGAELDAQDRPHFLVSFGDASFRWTMPRDITGDIVALDTSQSVQAARVTAGTYRPDSGHIHLVTQVRTGTNGASAPAADGTGSAFSKALVVLRSDEGVVTSLDLGLGQLARSDASNNPNPSDFGVFDDLYDGLFTWTSGNEVIEYMAYGDNGYVRFAEVEEEGFAPPPVLVAPQTIAVPLATAGTNPALYGSAAALLSLSMVARFVARRNKVTSEVEVGA